LNGKIYYKKQDQTYFPAGWSDVKIMDEITGAFSVKVMTGTQTWQGVSPSGITISGSINPNNGLITNAYPVL
jgi:hypothetical protein